MATTNRYTNGSETVELRGFNREWWFVNLAGAVIKNHFESPDDAHTWAIGEGFTPEQQAGLITPLLFTAIVFGKVDDGYEVSAFHVAAVNSRQAQAQVLAFPGVQFEEGCQRFILTDEYQALNPISAVCIDAGAQGRNVVTTADLLSWVEAQTKPTPDSPATYRPF